MDSLERISEHAAEKSLIKVLRGRQGRITRADAEALTGLPSSVVEQTLTSMLTHYRSHLAATESGELLYAFDPAMIRRTAEPLRVRMEQFATLLWRFFTFTFKIAIALVLVLYFIIFLVLLVGLFVARVSGKRDDRDESTETFFPVDLLWWILPWNFWSNQRSHWSHRRLQTKKAKKVYLQVFDFVFGPTPKSVDTGAAEREILAYLRDHQGRLVASELVALQGLDLTQAEDEATRLMCLYNGEPEVTEDGVVVYVFRELRRTVDEGTPAPNHRWKYTWNNLEQTPVLTGNRPLADVIIGLMNAFNLVIPLWFIPNALSILGLEATSANLWLRVIPLCFSSTFFAIPLGRALIRAIREPGRQQRNRRRLLLSEIFMKNSSLSSVLTPSLNAPLDPAYLAKKLSNLKPAEEIMLQKEMNKMLVALDGDIVLESAEPKDIGKYLFPRLQEELLAVQKTRQATSIEEKSVGAIVFDSANELKE